MTKKTPRAQHVILVSVDGLLPAFYLDERWPAPAIQQIYREGAHAGRGARCEASEALALLSDSEITR